MARPHVYTWPIPDTDAICLLQSRTGPGNLIINGPILISTNFPGRVVFPGITRAVSLTSANNLSGANFTVTGLLNGSTISETRAGPNNNTVETTAIFDEVTNISTNGTVSNVSVGTGLLGRTHWINYDYNKAYTFFSYQVDVTGNIQWTSAYTNDEVGTNPSPSMFPIQEDQTVSDNEDGQLSCVSLALFVEGTDNTGALTFTFIQQGIV